MKRCPTCQERYPTEVAYCPMDGAELIAVMMAAPPRGSERIGDVLDRRYRLDEVIGEGGMGLVYRATHTLIGKQVAVKILRPDQSDRVLRERFLREARLASTLKHTNIVDIIDYGEIKDSAYYVMELLEGETLAARIAEKGPLEPSEALEVALQVAQGLGAAHAHDIIHRDLKPDNVFVCKGESEAGRIKLLDFGIACALRRRMTAAGAILGTPEYMSPEQARGDDVDARSDIYSLGIILFEMLTGDPPFVDDDLAQVLRAQITADAPALSEVEPSLANLTQIEQAIARLLAKQPDDRPANAMEAVAILAEAMVGDLSGTGGRGRSTRQIGSWGIGASAPTPHVHHAAKWAPEAIDAADDEAARIRISPPGRAIEPVPVPPAFDGGPSQQASESAPARPAATTTGNGPPLWAIALGAAALAAVVTITMRLVLGGDVNVAEEAEVEPDRAAHPPADPVSEVSHGGVLSDESSTPARPREEAVDASSAHMPITPGDGRAGADPQSSPVVPTGAKDDAATDRAPRSRSSQVRRNKSPVASKPAGAAKKSKPSTPHKDPPDRSIGELKDPFH